jgi:hypothetical protein
VQKLHLEVRDLLPPGLPSLPRMDSPAQPNRRSTVMRQAVIGESSAPARQRANRRTLAATRQRTNRRTHTRAASHNRD